MSAPRFDWESGGLSQAWLRRIGGSLAMAVVLALLLLRFYITPDMPLPAWSFLLLLPAGFVVWVALEVSTRPLVRRLSAATFRMQRGPVLLGRVSGVPLLVDQTFFLLGVAALPGILAAPLAGLVAAVAFAALLLLHESGHAVAAHRQGCTVLTVELHALHGLTTFTEPLSLRARVIIAWGGVVAQLAVAIPAAASFWILPPAAEWLEVALFVLGPLSVLLAAVNLIPARGLDGEYAWQSLRRRSTSTRGRVVPIRPRWRPW